MRSGQSKKGLKDVTSIAVETTMPHINTFMDLGRLAYDSGVIIKGFHSRPTGEDREIAFIDLLGYQDDENVRRYCERVQSGSFGQITKFTELGSYPWEPFFPSNIDRIGVIGNQERINKVLSGFFKKCGYETMEGKISGEDTVKYCKNMVWRSDVIVANRPGRKQLMRMIANIESDLSDDMLLVINSPNAKHLRDALKFKQLPCRILYMDAPIITKSPSGPIPLTGQNIIFMSEDGQLPPPDSKELAFISNYYAHKANVTHTDFDGHAHNRNFSMNVPAMSDYFLMRMGNLTGIDFSELPNFENPTEKIRINAGQRTIASGISPRALSRYAREHRHDISNALAEMDLFGYLPPEEISAMVREAASASNDMERAIHSISALHAAAIAPDEPMTPIEAIRNISGICEEAKSYSVVI